MPGTKANFSKDEKALVSVSGSVVFSFFFLRLEKVQNLFLHHQSDRGASKRSHLSAGVTPPTSTHTHTRCLPTMTLELLSWAFVVVCLCQNEHDYFQIERVMTLLEKSSKKMTPATSRVPGTSFLLRWLLGFRYCFLLSELHS